MKVLIVTRQPVEGENSQRRFVGVVDDCIGGYFFPLVRPITNDLQLQVLILNGHFPINEFNEFAFKISAAERIMAELWAALGLRPLDELCQDNKGKEYSMEQCVDGQGQPIPGRWKVIEPLQIDDLPVVSTSQAAEGLVDQPNKATSIREFDAEIRARGEVPIYDEGGGILASYPDPDKNQ